uniref:Uncharacterized protein n=1 Tax=Arundo donax TaxID=35708 RepID=A0A0A9FNY9_ARUDO
MSMQPHFAYISTRALSRHTSFLTFFSSI